MKNKLKTYGYNITTDPQFQNKRFGITPELQKQFTSLYFESQDKTNNKIIEKLTELIIKYPTVPILKNYLSIAYNVQGKHEKALEVNRWILSEHPNYLFALINEANNFIDNKAFSKVPEILGEAMEIKALYPDRDIFHLSEVTGFYTLAIRYYVALGNQELAENRLEILQELAPNHPDTEQAENYLMRLKFKNASARFEEENKQRISPILKKLIPASKKTNAPKFNHPQIQNLYHFGIDIPHQKLQEIIALPHISLVEDLEKVLEDAIERHTYFSEIEWEEETHHFALHALFLLKEINAVESLSKIISILSHDKDILEICIGDHITLTIWQCFYSLGFNDTELLKEFLLLPGVDTYSKTCISEALCQMVLHHPEKRNEILTVYTEVLTAFSQATPEDNLIDSDFLGLTIGDAIECNLHELIPIIKVLYEKCYVSIGILGNYNKVEKAFANRFKTDHKRRVFNIFELYNDVLTNWAGNQEAGDSPNYRIPQQADSFKVGRNEPCPCGSGKKYKKCCGKN